MASVTQKASDEWQRWDPQPVLSVSRSVSPLESVCRGLSSDHLPEVHIDPELQSTIFGIGIFADTVEARISK